MKTKNYLSIIMGAATLLSVMSVVAVRSHTEQNILTSQLQSVETAALGLDDLQGLLGKDWTLPTLPGPSTTTTTTTAANSDIASWWNDFYPKFDTLYKKGFNGLSSALATAFGWVIVLFGFKS